MEYIPSLQTGNEVIQAFRLFLVPFVSESIGWQWLPPQALRFGAIQFRVIAQTLLSSNNYNIFW
ncbi:hypothetical protein [Nostoc sphaeroides]|uniref:Uncharacterized protein n=1 Tax=Nostoc sphaeroides CCNUC1 TaxID=2653204 RepID=A0A5P8VQL2_9NOSO|nr:hypothetical protein [Nostoc sphaeroides]MCC5627723.1 hypothetical protein [Nostoc sphaeroides CHAB 2801]QFS42702.1 hypothetical protein GXM_00175 [Nostoc sphaeroides CCNUC1]